MYRNIGYILNFEKVKSNLIDISPDMYSTDLEYIHTITYIYLSMKRNYSTLNPLRIPSQFA